MLLHQALEHYSPGVLLVKVSKIAKSAVGYSAIASCSWAPRGVTRKVAGQDRNGDTAGRTRERDIGEILRQQALPQF
jgi:hypothetical protein